MQYNSEELKGKSLGDIPEYEANVSGLNYLGRLEDADINADTIFVNKVISTNIKNITLSSLTEFTVNHGLGYRPVVKGYFWTDDNDYRELINLTKVCVKGVSNDDFTMEYILTSGSTLYLKLYCLEIEAI